MSTLWFVEATWIDTSHGKDCDTCYGKMKQERMKFVHILSRLDVFELCICPAKDAETTDTKCVCTKREATPLERRAFGNGMSYQRKLEKESR
jgi:hypothetical protein